MATNNSHDDDDDSPMFLRRLGHTAVSTAVHVNDMDNDSRADDLRDIALGPASEARQHRYAPALYRETASANRRRAINPTDSEEETMAREQLRRQVSVMHPEDEEQERRETAARKSAVSSRLAFSLSTLDSEDTRGSLASRSVDAQTRQTLKEDEVEDAAVLLHAHMPWALRPSKFFAPPAPHTRGADAKDRSAQELDGSSRARAFVAEEALGDDVSVYASLRGGLAQPQRPDPASFTLRDASKPELAEASQLGWDVADADGDAEFTGVALASIARASAAAEALADHPYVVRQALAEPVRQQRYAQITQNSLAQNALVSVARAERLNEARFADEKTIAHAAFDATNARENPRLSQHVGHVAAEAQFTDAWTIEQLSQAAAARVAYASARNVSRALNQERVLRTAVRDADALTDRGSHVRVKREAHRASALGFRDGLMAGNDHDGVNVSQRETTKTRSVAGPVHGFGDDVMTTIPARELKPRLPNPSESIDKTAVRQDEADEVNEAEDIDNARLQARLRATGWQAKAAAAALKEARENMAIEVQDTLNKDHVHVLHELRAEVVRNDLAFLASSASSVAPHASRDVEAASNVSRHAHQVLQTRKNEASISHSHVKNMDMLHAQSVIAESRPEIVDARDFQDMAEGGAKAALEASERAQKLLRTHANNMDALHFQNIVSKSQPEKKMVDFQDMAEEGAKAALEASERDHKLLRTHANNLDALHLQGVVSKSQPEKKMVDFQDMAEDGAKAALEASERDKKLLRTHANNMDALHLQGVVSKSQPETQMVDFRDMAEEGSKAALEARARDGKLLRSHVNDLDLLQAQTIVLESQPNKKTVTAQDFRDMAEHGARVAEEAYRKQNAIVHKSLVETNALVQQAAAANAEPPSVTTSVFGEVQQHVVAAATAALEALGLGGIDDDDDDDVVNFIQTRLLKAKTKKQALVSSPALVPASVVDHNTSRTVPTAVQSVDSPPLLSANKESLRKTEAQLERDRLSVRHAKQLAAVSRTEKNRLAAQKAALRVGHRALELSTPLAEDHAGNTHKTENGEDLEIAAHGAGTRPLPFAHPLKNASAAERDALALDVGVRLLKLQAAQALLEMQEGAQMLETPADAMPQIDDDTVPRSMSAKEAGGRARKYSHRRMRKQASIWEGAQAAVADAVMRTATQTAAWEGALGSRAREDAWLEQKKEPSPAELAEIRMLNQHADAHEALRVHEGRATRAHFGGLVGLEEHAPDMLMYEPERLQNRTRQTQQRSANANNEEDEETQRIALLQQWFANLEMEDTALWPLGLKDAAQDEVSSRFAPPAINVSESRGVDTTNTNGAVEEDLDELGIANLPRAFVDAGTRNHARVQARDILSSKLSERDVLDSVEDSGAKASDQNAQLLLAQVQGQRQGADSEEETGNRGGFGFGGYRVHRRNQRDVRTMASARAADAASIEAMRVRAIAKARDARLRALQSRRIFDREGISESARALGHNDAYDYEYDGRNTTTDAAVTGDAMALDNDVFSETDTVSEAGDDTRGMVESEEEDIGWVTQQSRDISASRFRRVRGGTSRGGGHERRSHFGSVLEEQSERAVEALAQTPATPYDFSN